MGIQSRKSMYVCCPNHSSESPCIFQRAFSKKVFDLERGGDYFFYPPQTSPSPSLAFFSLLVFLSPNPTCSGPGSSSIMLGSAGSILLRVLAAEANPQSVLSKGGPYKEGTPYQKHSLSETREQSQLGFSS